MSHTVTKHVVMVAAENDALRGGKVGGVGDVVRDLPRALAAQGWKITVITPSYGFLQKNNPATLVSSVQFPFGGILQEAQVFEVTPREPIYNVRCLVIDHPAIRGNPIYYDDPASSPFMRDATKYALWCSAVGKYLLSFDEPFVLHLHDWHAATILLLRELHPEFKGLKGIHTAFTIHNLAIQGTRPMRGHPSSVEEWFPELFSDVQWITAWKDHRYETPCYTPMSAGIKHADTVNTVSPQYAREILMPSDPPNGFYGGEGFEQFLRKRKRQGALFGVLNGCQYPRSAPAVKVSRREVWDIIFNEVAKLREQQGDPFHDEMLARVNALRNDEPLLMLTSITRVVDQKIRLLFECGEGGCTALGGIMSDLRELHGCYVVLGSGTKEFEDLLTKASGAYDRLLFIKGYSELIGQTLYANGSLFLMPSSFEPCGISQMIAMREGQPCVVHAVGGLKDTVRNNVNGFTFSGSSLPEQVKDFVKVTRGAMEMYLTQDSVWGAIVRSAREERFTWEKSAQAYIEYMYS